MQLDYNILSGNEVQVYDFKTKKVLKVFAKASCEDFYCIEKRDKVRFYWLSIDDKLIEKSEYTHCRDDYFSTQEKINPHKFYLFRKSADKEDLYILKNNNLVFICELSEIESMNFINRTFINFKKEDGTFSVFDYEQQKFIIRNIDYNPKRLLDEERAETVFVCYNSKNGSFNLIDEKGIFLLKEDGDKIVEISSLLTTNKFYATIKYENKDQDNYQKLYDVKKEKIVLEKEGLYAFYQYFGKDDFFIYKNRTTISNGYCYDENLNIIFEFDNCFLKGQHIFYCNKNDESFIFKDTLKNYVTKIPKINRFSFFKYNESIYIESKQVFFTETKKGIYVFNDDATLFQQEPYKKIFEIDDFYCFVDKKGDFEFYDTSVGFVKCDDKFKKISHLNPFLSNVLLTKDQIITYLKKIPKTKYSEPSFANDLRMVKISIYKNNLITEDEYAEITKLYPMLKMESLPRKNIVYLSANTRLKNLKPFLNDETVDDFLRIKQFEIWSE